MSIFTDRSYQDEPSQPAGDAPAGAPADDGNPAEAPQAPTAG
ncbi:MAG TPA: hypothetical protein VFB03_04040 [Candidatus Saccharimonadales bacterium]|nr:hypothetical protein [Candidatus Saccharimonadales bacterium]